MTMWGFVGIVAIFGIAGFTMIHYEKKYNMINGDEASKAAAKAADNAASSAN